MMRGRIDFRFSFCPGSHKILDGLEHLKEVFVGEKIVICAWCGRLKEGKRWVKLNQIFTYAESLKITHGMCRDCYVRETGEEPEDE